MNLTISNSLEPMRHSIYQKEITEISRERVLETNLTMQKISSNSIIRGFKGVEKGLAGFKATSHALDYRTAARFGNRNLRRKICRAYATEICSNNLRNSMKRKSHK